MDFIFGKVVRVAGKRPIYVQQNNLGMLKYSFGDTARYHWRNTTPQCRDWIISW